jgi:hypothetical protein
MRTAILSNGSPAMLDAAVKAARLEPLLDAVVSLPGSPDREIGSLTQLPALVGAT